jgi:hypothetical protein
VLHPDKYLGRRDSPQEVYLPSLAGSGWELVLEDTLGEFVIAKHVEEYLDDSELAAAAAAGWDGDRFGVWADEDGQELIAWQLIWDSESEAAEFEAAYSRVIASRFAGATATDDVWWETDDVSVALLRDNDLVWVVWTVNRPIGEALLSIR